MENIEDDGERASVTPKAAGRPSNLLFSGDDELKITA